MKRCSNSPELGERLFDRCGRGRFRRRRDGCHGLLDECQCRRLGGHPLGRHHRHLGCARSRRYAGFLDERRRGWRDRRRGCRNSALFEPFEALLGRPEPMPRFVHDVRELGERLLQSVGTPPAASPRHDRHDDQDRPQEQRDEAEDQADDVHHHAGLQGPDRKAPADPGEGASWLVYSVPSGREIRTSAGAQHPRGPGAVDRRRRRPGGHSTGCPACAKTRAVRRRRRSDD